MSCPLEACKQKGRSKMHTLISKAKPLCLHEILAIAAAVPVKKTTKPVEHRINFKDTVKKVIKNIGTLFPSSFRSFEDGKFLAASKTYVDKMISSEEDLENSLKWSVPTMCDTCHCNLEEWKHKSPRSYLITLGKLSENEKFFNSLVLDTLGWGAHSALI